MSIAILAAMVTPSFADDMDLVLAEYRTCVDEARVKAGAMKSVALKEKIFMGRVKSCDRKRDAQLELIEVDQEFAKITENLIANARSELGL